MLLSHRFAVNYDQDRNNPVNRVVRVARWLWLAGLLVACGPSAATFPTKIPITSAAPQPTQNVSGGVPQTLTDLELNVGGLGEKSYSGYVCGITPQGCACETPVIQKVKFSFTPDNRLLYDFEPVGGEHTQWQLDHAGVNQWNFATPLKDSTGTTQALVLALLSFISDGYLLTQVTTMSTGEVVKCPDVIYRRLQP